MLGVAGPGGRRGMARSSLVQVLENMKRLNMKYEKENKKKYRNREIKEIRLKMKKKKKINHDIRHVFVFVKTVQ